MEKVTPISARKSDHIRINLQEDVRSDLTTGLENYHFIHQALPELNLEEVDLHVEFFNHRLNAPILISPMTGGTSQAQSINKTLAEAAQTLNIAMGLGSQRAAIDNPDLISTFQIRKYAPDILLFANLGAVQLNCGYGIEQCQRAVDMAEADALCLHLNPLQEAVQPDGETHFKGLLKNIEIICQKLPVPVIVKEVGWGISEQVAKYLAEAGVSAIDIAGAGGTSWSQVEMYRANNESQHRLAAAFYRWGIPTSDSIIYVRRSTPQMKIIASGGLRTGIDIAKCIALGATLGGMANPFLKSATISVESTLQVIQEITREIQVCMFASGVASISQLQNTPLVHSK
ncbi:MAG: type 2 isopentenyl-diphosphate Delta-isomerase [Anaerolineales bacterium]|nr:type 2 isopentenyl-diphosphate Delta-isomerase [Anaerolineales bacterium]